LAAAVFCGSLVGCSEKAPPLPSKEEAAKTPPLPPPSGPQSGQSVTDK